MEGLWKADLKPAITVSKATLLQTLLPREGQPRSPKQQAFPLSLEVWLSLCGVPWSGFMANTKGHINPGLQTKAKISVEMEGKPPE